jgi:DNA-binding response OmpR family regulator
MALILVVEDDHSVRENLEEILHFKGFSVVSADNAKLGIKLANEKEPDLIISDIMMPEVDGYTFLQQVKSSAKLSATPVILLTAKTLTESKIRGLEYGADDYITKPFNAKELIARVHNIIDIRRKIKAEAFLQSNKVEVESADDAFMRELLGLFSDNLENSYYAIEDVVQALGFSKSTIQRKIKNITGKTFNQLLREFRLEQAKQILEQKGGNISEVAYIIGFNSVSYFSYSFKNYFGFPPTEVKPEK